MLQKLPKPHDPHESYESVYVRFMLDTFPRVVTEDFACDVTQAVVNGQEAVYTDPCAYGNLADPYEVLRLIQEREAHVDTEQENKRKADAVDDCTADQEESRAA